MLMLIHNMNNAEEESEDLLSKTGKKSALLRRMDKTLDIDMQPHLSLFSLRKIMD
jgi:hypothetical protein